MAQRESGMELVPDFAFRSFIGIEHYMGRPVTPAMHMQVDLFPVQLLDEILHPVFAEKSGSAGARIVRVRLHQRACVVRMQSVKVNFNGIEFQIPAAIGAAQAFQFHDGTIDLIRQDEMMACFNPQR